MAAPISNNNPALIDHKRAGSTSSEDTGNDSKTASGNEEAAAMRQDDAISVSNVAQALGSSATAQSGTTIQNADQAAALAQIIAEFFAQNGPGALAAHANDNAGLADLLKAS